MNIGERIKHFRTLRGITVNKLANISGVSQSYLRDIELGNKQPTVEYLSYICDALNISLKKFFSNDEQDTELNKLLDELDSEQKTALISFIKSMQKTE